MSQERAAVNTSAHSSSSSLDSLADTGKAPTPPPDRAAPGRPASSPVSERADAVVVPQITAARRAPSADEVLDGGRSFISEERTIAEEESPFHSLQRPGEAAATSMSRLASRHFFEEMGTLGILAVERGSFTVPRTPDTTDRSPESDGTESVHREREGGASYRSSVRRREEHSPGERGTPRSSKRSASRPSPTPRKVKPTGRDMARSSLEGLSPPPVTAPLSGQSAEQRASPGRREEHARSPPPQPYAMPAAWPSLRFPLPTPHSEAAGMARSLPLHYPSAHKRAASRAIPVTRLLQEEGQGIVAEEAVLWRRRCHELEATVARLEARLAQKNTQDGAQEERQQRGGSWREEANAFGRGNTSPSPLNRPRSSALLEATGDTAAVSPPSKKPESRIGSHRSPPAASSSLAPRSISPQSPHDGLLLPVMDNPEGGLAAGDAEAACHSPHLHGSVPLAAYHHPIERSGEEGGQARHLLREATAKESSQAEHNTEVDRSNDTTTRGDSADALVFVESAASGSGQQQAIIPGPECTAKQEDNLALVLAERQAREWKEGLQRAREQIDGLQMDLDQRRLRCDELETQVLTQEEQMASQKDQADQHILELREEIARLRGAKGDAEHSDAQGPPPLRSDVVPVDGILQKGTEESHDAMTGVHQVIRSSPEAAEKEVASLGTSGSSDVTAAGFCKFVSELASVVDPDNNHGAILAGITEDSAAPQDVAKAAELYVSLAQEMMDTQAIQLAELREELLVVRKDRNELIGQQSEQVRLLQEELLEKDTEQLQLMERAEAMREELEALRSEKERAEQQQQQSAGESCDRAEEEHPRQESCKACAALEEKLRDQQASSAAAQRAQHNVFAERLASAQDQLRRVRVVTDEERGKYERELASLRAELESTRAALQAKEVALGIALREDIRQSLQRTGSSGSDDEDLRRMAAPSPSTQRGLDEGSDAFQALKISSGARTTSLSLSSQGHSTGESTAATRRAKSGSSGSPSVSSGVLLDSEAAAPAQQSLPPPPAPASAAVPGSLARLLSTRSPDSFNGADDHLHTSSSSSPSPISVPDDQAGVWLGSAVRERSAGSQSSASPSPFVAALLALQRAPGDTSPPERRVPSRRAPKPSPPSAAGGGALPHDGSRKVTFVGVPPLTPSPLPKAQQEPSPAASAAEDAAWPAGAARWPHDVSRSLSPFFTQSPTNTAFLQDESTHDDGEASTNREDTGGSLRVSPLQAEVLPSPLAAETPVAPPVPLLRQRPGSAANSARKPETSGKKRKFVKMGSLQRMREVWAKQESLLLSSPSSLEKDGSPASP